MNSQSTPKKTGPIRNYQNFKVTIYCVNFGKWYTSAPVSRIPTNKSFQYLLTVMSRKHCNQNAFVLSHIIQITKLKIYNRKEHKFEKLDPKFGQIQIREGIQHLSSEKLQQYRKRGYIHVKLSFKYIWKWETEKIKHFISESTQLDQKLNDLVCPISYLLMQIPYQLQCGHIFQFNNIWEITEGKNQNGDKRCPLCRALLTGGRIYTQIMEKMIKQLD